MSKIFCMLIVCLVIFIGSNHAVAQDFGPHENDPSASKISTAIVSPRLWEKVINERPIAKVTKAWLDEPKPFLPMFLTSAFFLSMAWIFLSKYMHESVSLCASQFWKSFGTGVVFLFLMGTFARILQLIGITAPLSMIIAAAMQMFLLLGYCVGSRFLANRICRWGMPDSSKRVLVLRGICEVVLVSLFFASICQIRPFGLPPIGMRLILLMAILGGGALLNYWRHSSKH